MARAWFTGFHDTLTYELEKALAGDQTDADCAEKLRTLPRAADAYRANLRELGPVAREESQLELVLYMALQGLPRQARVYSHMYLHGGWHDPLELRCVHQAILRFEQEYGSVERAPMPERAVRRTSLRGQTMAQQLKLMQQQEEREMAGVEAAESGEEEADEEEEGEGEGGGDADGDGGGGESLLTMSDVPQLAGASPPPPPPSPDHPSSEAMSRARMISAHSRTGGPAAAVAAAVTAAVQSPGAQPAAAPAAGGGAGGGEERVTRASMGEEVFSRPSNRCVTRCTDATQCAHELMAGAARPTFICYAMLCYAMLCYAIGLPSYQRRQPGRARSGGDHTRRRRRRRRR